MLEGRGMNDGLVTQERDTSLDAIHAGDLVIDPRRRLVLRHGERLSVRPRLMFDVLVALARDPYRVFTKSELSLAVWKYDMTAFPQNGNDYRRYVSRTVESHLSKLRSALGEGYVVNCWGVGWSLLDPASEPAIEVAA